MTVPTPHNSANCPHPDCQFEAENGYNPADPLTDANWTPLILLLGRGVLADWMWVYTRGDLQSYKHKDTRRYLNIDSHGRTWRWREGDTYEAIPVADALAWALG